MSSNAAQFGWCTAGRIINWHYRNRKFSLAGRDIFFYFGWHGVDSYTPVQNSSEQIRIQPLFERIPPSVRGRVFGAITAGAWLAMPLGMLLGGVLTETRGTFMMMIGLAIT